MKKKLNLLFKSKAYAQLLSSVSAVTEMMKRQLLPAHPHFSSQGRGLQILHKARPTVPAGQRCLVCRRAGAATHLVNNRAN